LHWEFPARGELPPVTLHWYDGGLRPPIPRELDADGEAMPEEGMLFVGDSGKILAGFSGENPRLLPRERMRSFAAPAVTLPRPPDELTQFIQACRGGPEPVASFERAGAFSETILLGTIALRVGRKLRWDSTRFAFADAPEATALMSRKYREGWSL
jgi:hypothetical protein